MSELTTRDDFSELYEKERLNAEEIFDEWLDRTGRREEWCKYVACEDPYIRLFLGKEKK